MCWRPYWYDDLLVLTFLAELIVFNRMEKMLMICWVHTECAIRSNVIKPYGIQKAENMELGSQRYKTHSRM